MGTSETGSKDGREEGGDAALPCYLSVLAGTFGSTNRNALLSVWYTFFVNLSNGLALAGVVAIYLQELTQSNMKVGYAEGVFGFMSLVPGLVGGYFSDKFRRDRVLRWSGWVSLLGIVFLLAVCISCLASSKVDGALDANIPHFGSEKFLVICIAVCILYGGESIGDAASKAILGDSLTTGNRQAFMTKLNVVVVLAYGVGPLLCAAIEAASHNEWTRRNLLVLLVVGIAVRVPCALICFVFDDAWCMAEESEAFTEAAVVEKTEEELVQYRRVPMYYFAADILWCFGSGMTVKFFPIFFKSDPDVTGEGLGLQPTTLFLITAAAELLVAPFSGIGLSASKVLGRIQTDILLWYLGIACLAGMCAMGYTHHYSKRTVDRVVVLGLYLLRTAVLQASDPIQQSVLMDFVPKAQRARWASVQAITAAGWCGSAAVGGWLSDRYSYNFAFLVTCVFHVLSTFAKAPMLWIVPRQQKTLEEHKKAAADAPAPPKDAREDAPLLTTAP